MTQLNPMIPAPTKVSKAKVSDTDVASRSAGSRGPMNPLIAAASGPAKRSNSMIAPASRGTNPLIHNPEMPEPSNLEAVANVLSLPGSSVVDALAGENPLDQWKTPTRSENRTTGKQLLQKHNILDDNDSWQSAVAGVATEIALDPTTYLGFGIATKGGKALSKAGLLKGSIDNLTDATSKTVRQVINEADNADHAMKAFELAGGKAEHLDQPIKHVLSFGGTDLAKPLAPAIDAATDAVKASAPMRHLRSLFDPKVLNTTSEAAQKIAEHRSDALNDAIVNVGSKFAPVVQSNDLAGAKTLLSDIAKEAEQSGLELSKFQPWTEADDVSTALANAERLTKASALSHASSEMLGLSARTAANERTMSMADAIKRLNIDSPQTRKAIEDWSGGKTFDSLHIDKAMVDDAERMLRPTIDEATIGGVRKAVEGFTRIFKAHVTAFPSFHVRNLVGGQLQNIILGTNRIQDLGDDLATAWRLRSGKTPQHLSSQIPDYKDLNPEEAAQRLREEIFAHNIVGDWQPGAADVGKIKPDAASRMPGANPLMEKAKPTITESLNPMDPSKFALTRISGNVASTVEYLNRISGFVGLRRSGFSPSEASKRIKQLHGDYNSATRAENSVARNAIPFYQFSKKMLGLTADELMHRPGGRLGIAIKASAASDKDKRGEASLKLGDTRYSGFGEMHKDAVDTLGAFMRGDAKSLGKQLGNKLNPLIKHPLEVATGYDLRSGRPLDKMPPAVEELLGVPVGPMGEHAARNSPFARYLSEAQRLQKKQEAGLLKFLTGVNSGE